MTIGHVMLDLAGPDLSPVEKDIIRHPQVGGIILFSRNYETKKQLRELTKNIRKLSPDSLIAVDQEGGRVQRFLNDFTRLPAFEDYGVLYEKNQTQALETAQKMSFVMAKELQDVGVNMSFTPVLDLNLKINEIIGERSFHGDHNIVIKLAQAFIEGLHHAGMPATGKHFPGHGSVKADSHLTLPVDDRDFESIYQQDMQPFIQLHEQLDAIMPAHILYEAVDKYPTCFSNYWLQDVLRSKLNYRGVIFSDDLSMEGANLGSDYKDRARLALDAGCDMILVCNNQENAIRVLDEFENYSNNISTQRLKEFCNKCKSN